MSKKIFLASFLALFNFPAFAEEVDCDMELGKSQFSKCAACHSLEKVSPPMAGPNLHMIVNKQSGADSEFPYSMALMDSPRVWTPAALDKFLKQPMADIPGTAMAFAGIKKPHQRAALICYLNGGETP